MSVLGDGRRPVRRVFGLEQRTLFVELSTPGRVRCVTTCCSIQSLKTSSGALHVAAFTIEPRRLRSFPDDDRLRWHVLVDERAQDVVVAGEQVVDIGWWVVDKWRLQKIVREAVYVKRTPPAADMTCTGVRMWNTVAAYSYCVAISSLSSCTNVLQCKR